MNKGIVHIVHHVDTEGPLREPPDVAARSKKLYDQHLARFNTSWTAIDRMLERIMAKKFRNELRDSFGGGWIYNWHIMDHAGYLTNERHRDLGYLKVFNHYEKMLKKTNSRQDRIQWHFHPISFYREAHISATSYENSYPEIHQILTRRLIEKKWFPQVNRAGFHTIRPDSNWFLEQWMPFDASNQSIHESGKPQADAVNGRFGDWQGAPDTWDIYHPDLYDWRKEGNLRRVTARALNLHTRFRNLTRDEMVKAFRKAQRGESVYLGITNHDFRDMELEINEFRNMLRDVAAEYPKVPFKFSESVDAFRAVLGLVPEKFAFMLQRSGTTLKVTVSQGEIFGAQPYLAIKTKKGEYFHDNFDFGSSKKEFFYTFDRLTVPWNQVRSIAVAANDRFGSICIKKLS